MIKTRDLWRVEATRNPVQDKVKDYKSQGGTEAETLVRELQEVLKNAHKKTEHVPQPILVGPRAFRKKQFWWKQSRIAAWTLIFLSSIRLFGRTIDIKWWNKLYRFRFTCYHSHFRLEGSFNDWAWSLRTKVAFCNRTIHMHCEPVLKN